MSEENVKKFEDVPLTEPQPEPKPRVTIVSQEEVVAAIQPEVTSSSLEESVVIEIENDTDTKDEQPSTILLQTRAGQPGVCYLCDNKCYQEQKALSSAKEMIKPCFCDVEAHHGCLTAEVLKRKTCEYCHVYYRTYKYGTILDFIRYKWISFLCIGFTALPFLISGLIISLRCWPLKFWYNWSLFFFGVLLFVIGAGLLAFFLRKMFWNNYPKFVERMSNITVHDNDAVNNLRATKKPKRSEMRAAYHKKSEARRMNLTAGQQLLGHDRTHSGQTSSTPLEDKEHIRFHFETPATLI